MRYPVDFILTQRAAENGRMILPGLLTLAISEEPSTCSANRPRRLDSNLIPPLDLPLPKKKPTIHLSPESRGDFGPCLTVMPITQS